jgi:hypothetical protein
MRRNLKLNLWEVLVKHQKLLESWTQMLRLKWLNKQLNHNRAKQVYLTC